MAACAQLADVLAATVFIDGANRAFGDLTPDQVRNRADELRAAVGFGPTARIAPVARAWRELAMALDQAGAGTVGQLEAERVLVLAPQLWIVPPGGSLL
ncbi:MAG TPA: hypothetical protein VF781_10215 [Solirubrobacteraceae bacterium]